MLTHENLRSVSEGAGKVVEFTEDDSVLSVLPLFHALAQVANLAMPLTTGARAVFIETINTNREFRMGCRENTA